MAKKSAAAAPQLSAAIIASLKEWQQLNEWLEKAAPREAELRRLIADTILPEDERQEGVNHIVTVIDGVPMRFTIEHKINRKLDEQVLDSVMLSLPEDSDARKLGFLIEYRPRLVLSGYRALPADQLQAFQAALTETPGMPALKVEPADAAPASPQAAPEPAPVKKRSKKTKA